MKKPCTNILAALCERALNSLPSDNSLDWSKPNAFADYKMNVAQMTIVVFNRVENIVGKRRKFWLLAFFPFSQCFQKPSNFRLVKTRDCVVKGKCICEGIDPRQPAQSACGPNFSVLCNFGMSRYHF